MHRSRVILAGGVAIAILIGILSGLPGAPDDAPLSADPSHTADLVSDGPVLPAVPDRGDATDSAPVERAESTPPPWVGDLIESEREEDEPLPALGTIAGRVAWRDGMPVEGARVRLQREPRDTVIPEPGEDFAPAVEDDPAASTVTTRTGEFTLGYVPHRETLFLRFELRDGTVEIEDLRVPPRKGERTWQGEFLLDARGTVTGTIVDADGEPVASATIRAVDEERFDDPAVPWEVRESRIAGAETLKLDRQSGGRSLTAALRVRDRVLPFPAATSRRDGSFTVRGVREGLVHVLVQHDKLVSRRIDIPVVGGRETDAGVIALGRGLPLTVRLLDAELRPLVGLSVAVAPAGWRFGPPAETSDSNGLATFQLDVTRGDPRAGDLGVTAGVRRGPGKPWASLGSASLPGATWVLATDGRFDAWIRTSDGSQPDRVQFGTAPESRGVRWSGTGGAYRIAGVPPESAATLYALALGYAPAVATIAPVGYRRFPLHAEGDDFRSLQTRPLGFRPPVEMTLVPTFDARVRVVDDHRQPLPGARVRFSAAPSEQWKDVPGTGWGGIVRGWRLGTTDARGEFVARGLWNTHTTFTAWHPERGRVHLWLREVARGQVVELQLLSPARVTGTVLENGQPVTRRYELRLELPPPARPPEGVGYYDPVTITTNDLGQFEVPRVGPWPWPVEPWRMTLGEPSQVPRAGMAFSVPGSHVSRRRHTEPLRLNAGEHADITIDLSGSDDRERPDIAGVVRIGGIPAHRAQVELWARARRTTIVRRRIVSSNEIECVDTIATDNEGRFAFFVTRNQDREVRVKLQRRGHIVEVARARVPEARRRETTEPIVIDVPVGELTLTLRDAEGRPLANRPVALLGIDDGPRLLVVADDLGVVREHGVPAGSYDVVATDRFGAPTVFAPPVVVPAGDSTFETRNAPRR